jgi:ubiquinone/menaquinone biosynthesis C-methylase UbiE
MKTQKKKYIIYLSKKRKEKIMSNDIFKKFNGISDEEFLELLIRADKEPVIGGVKMPGFPDLSFQMKSVGMRGADDLRHAPFKFASSVKKYAEEFNTPINKNTKLLDFGIGWGRMIRFFFKDILSENLYGIDAWQIMVDKCNELLPAGNYSVNNPHPPIEFADNTFDVIISYSVFSHLRADAAEMWIKEFKRILKPNGIVVATTEGLRFLNLIERIQNNPEMAAEHSWYEVLQKGFNEPIAEYRKRHSAGEFIYAATGGGDSLDDSFYGDAIVPEKYINDVWGEHLALKSFSDSEKEWFPQASFVLQKTV